MMLMGMSHDGFIGCGAETLTTMGFVEVRDGEIQGVILNPTENDANRFAVMCYGSGEGAGKSVGLDDPEAITTGSSRFRDQVVVVEDAI